MKRDPKTKSMIRTFLVYIAALAMGILILVKVVMVQTKEGAELRALADQMETRFDTLWASRGNILACDGLSMLATDAPIYDISINPSHIPDDLFAQNIDELSQKLAELFPKKNAKQWKSGLTSAKENQKMFFQVDLNATPAQYQELEACKIFHQKNKIIGLEKKAKYIRIHPYDPLAGRIIGYVRNGNVVGLESAYDSILRGKNGLQKYRHDTWARLDDERNAEAVNGCDIITTIDIGIQDITERALRDALVKSKAEMGCAIVMEVSTGEIKAIANLKRNGKTNQYEESYNFALGVGIEPGSTFKLASMLVLLEKHPELDINKRNVNIGKRGSTLKFGGAPMSDDHAINDDGRVTIREVFEQSSNKGTAKLITDYFEKDPKEYVEGLYALRLNDPLNTGIAGETPPRIIHPINNKNIWSKPTLSRMSIGYEVKLSPLQILTLYNAVANEGKMMKPMFVKAIQKDGVMLQTLEPVVLNEHIASPRIIDSIQSMMEGVVIRGTAKKLNGTEYGIAGKTGTAKLYNEANKSYSWTNAEGKPEKNYNATFAGYFPTKNPKYSCIVVMNKAHQSGGTVSAPVFKEIADKVYAIYIKEPTATPSEKTELKYVEYRPLVESTITELSQNTPQIVPDLKGMNITDAVYLTESLGWKPDFEGYGLVIDQDVPAGDSLQAGGVIKLTLTRK